MLFDEQGVITIILDEPTITVGDPATGTGDVIVNEGEDAVFSVDVTDAAAGSTLSLQLQDGTALDADYFDDPANDGKFEYSVDGGVIWNSVTGAIDLPAGNTFALVRTDTIDDLNDEDNESFGLIATLVSNETSYQATGTATIIDNDTSVFAQISVDESSVEEGGELTYTVTLVDQDGNEVAVPAGDSVTVSLAWTGDASNPSDAAPLPATVTISDGSTTSFVVDAIDDVYKEDPEALVATITAVDDVDDAFTSVLIGADNVATSEITDELTPPELDKVFVQISVDKDSVEEGGKLTYTVSLTDENGDPVVVPSGESVDVTIDWSGVAANDTDAAPLPETVTIANGSEFSFEVDAVDDVYKEDPEALIATITAVDYVDDAFEDLVIGDENVANATITDETTPDEDVVYAQISVDKSSVEEGGKLVYTVSLVDENGDVVVVPTSESITVNLDWSGDAANSSDAAPLPASVTITGNSEVIFEVDTIDDTIEEVQEDLIASISSVVDADEVFEDLQIHPENATTEIIDNDDTPVIKSVTNLIVSEEGLLNANPDSIGAPDDTTNNVSQTGVLRFTDEFNSGLSSFDISLSAPNEDISSQGELVTNWNVSNNGNTLIGSTGSGIDVIKIEIGSISQDSSLVNGFKAQYEVTLLAPVDHPVTTTEDKITLTFNFSVDELQGEGDAGSFQVTIEDDSPIANDITKDVEAPSVDTNLMIVLDLSGSMNRNANGDGNYDLESRLDLAKEAITSLINEYDDIGDVRVRIVTFDNVAEAYTDAWVLVDDAINYINSLSPESNNATTNFDGALSLAMDSFGSDGALDDAQNLSYSFSDGRPNRSDGDSNVLSNSSNGNYSNDNGIQSQEESLWIDFLKDQDINSIAIGIGEEGANDSSIQIDKLHPIAFNGISEDNTQATLVEDLSELESVLHNTIDVPLVTGNLLQNVSMGADGFGYV